MFCYYCQEPIYADETGTWIDSQGGDECFGDDELTNEGKPHVPEIGNE